MPRYSIRHYFENCDEFEVEAESADAAEKLVDTYLSARVRLVPEAPQAVKQVGKNVFCDWTSTMWNEIDADGMYMSDPEEL